MAIGIKDFMSHNEEIVIAVNTKSMQSEWNANLPNC